MYEDRKQFKKVTTGNGFQNDLIATTNDRLEITVIALQNLENALRSNLMFLQGDIQDLAETIRAANAKNDKLQKWFLGLAILGTIFTATQLIQVVDLLIRGIGK